MTESPPLRQGGRETRLLLAIIAISALTLLLLARLRFPVRQLEVAEPAPAPLERLAAQASYDELAATMGELDRRVRGSLMVFRVRPERPERSHAVATRVASDRAVVFLEPFESLVSTADATTPSILFRDRGTGIAVIGVEPSAERVATPRTGTPRPGPRYVAVADATPAGPSLRPLYVGATQLVEGGPTGVAMLSMAAAPQLVPRGAAIFTLAGAFVGIATGSPASAAIVPAEALKAVAEGQPPAPQHEGDFGVEVQSLSDAVARVAGAETGVVVSDVEPDGPAASLLQAGDVVQSIDGSPVASVEAFIALERSRTPAAAIPVAIVRRGSPSSVRIVPREMDPGATAKSGSGHGLTLRNVIGTGVEIVAVARGSAGQAAGLQRGDVVTSLDGRRTPTAADLDRAFAALGSDRGQTGVKPGSDRGQTGVRRAGDPAGLLLTIERGGARQVIALEKR